MKNDKVPMVVNRYESDQYTTYNEGQHHFTSRQLCGQSRTKPRRTTGAILRITGSPPFCSRGEGFLLFDEELLRSCLGPASYRQGW